MSAVLNTAMAAIVSPPRRSTGWWVSRIVLPLVSVAILVLLQYGLSQAILKATAGPGEEELSPWFFALIQMAYPIIALIGIIALTMTLGQGSDRSVSVLDLVSVYLITSLSHLLSGWWAIHFVQSQGMPGPGQALTLNLNLLGLTGFIGRMLDRLSIDEVLHLGLYGYFVSRLYQLRKSGWIYAGLAGLWFVVTTLKVATIRES